MNTNTIHHLPQKELKEFLGTVANKRDEVLTRRACDSLYCSPIPMASELAKSSH